MALNDHYLPEDNELLTDNLDRLHKSFSKALDCAVTANVDEYVKESILQSVNESLTMLMALNAKKLQRDQFNKMEYERRHFF